MRRLVVSLSRARLGLVVFADRSLYEPCAELKPALSQLCALPDKLQLLLHERHPTTRLVRRAAALRAMSRPPSRRPRTAARAMSRRARVREVLTRACALASLAQASETAPAPLEVVDVEHMMALVAEMAFDARRAAELAYSTAPDTAADDTVDGYEARASSAKRARVEHRAQADAAPAADAEAAAPAVDGELLGDDGAAPERDLDYTD